MRHFISFEGTEGAGKSTQLTLLTERLQKAGHTVRRLREPGGTLIGEEIRHTLQHSHDNEAMTPEAELLLLSASRAQLVREVIAPALKQGELVLCDRFYHSTLAYQGYGRGLDLRLIHQLVEFAVGEVRPERTLFLHVPVDVSEARRHGRARGEADPERDRMETLDRAFFERVEQGFLELARTEPDRIRVIDATRQVEAVAEDIWEAVRGLL